MSDEANTSRFWLDGATAGAPPHDWLMLTGGAIGQGLPLATGAAVASPDRHNAGSRSAMYTISALWTHAREELDITTIIFSNRSYAILGIEFDRVGAATSGHAARSLLDLSRPTLDFTALAAGMGVRASKATAAGELAVSSGGRSPNPGHTSSRRWSHRSASWRLSLARTRDHEPSPHRIGAGPRRLTRLPLSAMHPKPRFSHP